MSPPAISLMTKAATNVFNSLSFHCLLLGLILFCLLVKVFENIDIYFIGHVFRDLVFRDHDF